jgi:hypothetical protein
VLFRKPPGGGRRSGLGSTLLLFLARLLPAPVRLRELRPPWSSPLLQNAGPNSMKSKSWHIKLKAHLVGPLSSNELADLADKRSITRDTPVSPDGQRWIVAGSIQGLEFPQSNPPAVPSLAVRWSIDRIAWPRGWGRNQRVAAGIGIALAVIILIAFARTIVSPSNATGDRTFDYWTHVRSALQSAAKTFRAEDSEAAVESCRKIAESIEALPTAGVDQDAVTAGLALAALFKAKADVDETISSPAFLMQAFIRGANGDPFGASLDGLNANNAVNQRSKLVREKMRQTRAILSSRYGREFPPI